MKWIKVKKKKKDKRDRNIIKIKGNTFMAEEQIDERTRRFFKVDVNSNELRKLREQNYI